MIATPDLRSWARKSWDCWGFVMSEKLIVGTTFDPIEEL